MWPDPWTHVGTPSHMGHLNRVAATRPSQAPAGAASEAPDIGQWEGQDVPLVKTSSCIVKGGILSSGRYLPTYLFDQDHEWHKWAHKFRDYGAPESVQDGRTRGHRFIVVDVKYYRIVPIPWKPHVELN